MLVGLAKSKSFRTELSRMAEKAGPSFLTMLHWWVLFCLVGYLIVGVFSVYVCQVEHDLDQIDYIDSCATEEEEEEVRQPKCQDSDSLSSQFMAYIDQRRISNEVVLPCVHLIHTPQQIPWENSSLLSHLDVTLLESPQKLNL